MERSRLLHSRGAGHLPPRSLSNERACSSPPASIADKPRHATNQFLGEPSLKQYTLQNLTFNRKLKICPNPGH